MNLPPIHPMLVHFPIALILTALALDVLGMLFKSERIRAAVLPVLALAVLGAIAAIAAGLYAESQLKAVTDEINGLIGTHETMALSTLGAATLALIFRALAEYRKSIEGIPGQISFIFLLIATLLVGVTGYFGGELVFSHGAGTAFYEKVYKLSPSQSQTPSNEQNQGQTPAYHGEDHPTDWH